MLCTFAPWCLRGCNTQRPFHLRYGWVSTTIFASHIPPFRMEHLALSQWLLWQILNLRFSEVDRTWQVLVGISREYFAAPQKKGCPKGRHASSWKPWSQRELLGGERRCKAIGRYSRHYLFIYTGASSVWQGGESDDGESMLGIDSSTPNRNSTSKHAQHSA